MEQYFDFLFFFVTSVWAHMEFRISFFRISVKWEKLYTEL